MKKKLVASLAAAMVLGVAGTSFAAANPFTDVPAKHWAYDSVMKLSQAGIVDGYGDGTYKGDKLISRYEMAQMVAKAMAKSDKADAAQKAQIDKLAAEFAEELNVLGVRVSALEKKVGTVKVTGDARLRVSTNKVVGAVNSGGYGTILVNSAVANDTRTFERFRLNLNADVNENTSIFARVMIGQTEMGTENGAPAAGAGLLLSDAALTTKNVFNTGTTLTAGRFSQSLLGTGYLLGTTGFVDGAKVLAGNQLKVTTGFANFAAVSNQTTNVTTIGNAPAGAIDDAFFTTASYATSKVTTLYGAYLKETTGGTKSNFDLRGLGFTTKLDKDWSFAADYAVNASKNAEVVANESPKFYVTKLTYKGANAKVQGTWGAGIEYFKFDQNVVPIQSDFSTAAMIGLPSNSQGNYKGFALTTTYTLAKNVGLEAFQTFKTKTSVAGATSVDLPGFTRVQVNYTF